MHRPSSATLVLAALLLTGCADSPAGSDQRGLFATLPQAAGLDFDVSVAPERMELGDTALVTATVTNRTSATKELTFGGCQLWIEAEGAGGEEIPQEGGGIACAGVISHARLAPGESMRTTSRWTHTRLTYPPLGYALQPARTVRFRAVLGITVAPGQFLRSPETAELVVTDTSTYGAKADVSIAATARGPVRSGDTVTVNVRLENLRGAPVTMRFLQTCQVRVAFHLATPAEPASVIGDACGDALTSLTLGAREVRTIPLLWRATGRTGAALAPGMYTIRATLGTHPPERRLAAPITHVRVDP